MHGTTRGYDHWGAIVDDPFVRPGLIRRYKELIFERAAKCCEQYPWLDYDAVLNEAVRLARIAESRADPRLGDLKAFLDWHLRGLHRFANRKEKGEDQSRAKWERSQISLAPFDDDNPPANLEEFRLNFGPSSRRRWRVRKPKFPNGNGTRVTVDHRSAGDTIRTIIGYRLKCADENEVRAIVDCASSLSLEWLLQSGLVELPIDVQSYGHASCKKAASRRARRIAKAWGVGDPRRVELMDAAVVDAAEAIAPDLDDYEFRILNWLMSEHDGRRQAELAAGLGITKGAVSKIVRRVAARLRGYCASKGKI